MAYALFAFGVGCGFTLIFLGRPWVAFIGLLGLAVTSCYSASPMQLMSGGLWEGLIFLAFGPLLSWGAYYVQTGKLSLLGAVVSLALVWRAVCLAPHTAKTTSNLSRPRPSLSRPTSSWV